MTTDNLGERLADQMGISVTELNESIAAACKDAAERGVPRPLTAAERDGFDPRWAL